MLLTIMLGRDLHQFVGLIFAHRKRPLKAQFIFHDNLQFLLPPALSLQKVVLFSLCKNRINFCYLTAGIKRSNYALYTRLYLYIQLLVVQTQTHIISIIYMGCTGPYTSFTVYYTWTLLCAIDISYIKDCYINIVYFLKSLNKLRFNTQ